MRVNKVTEFGKVSASSSRSGFAVIVGYYKDSRHRNRRAHEPQKDQFIYKQTLSRNPLCLRSTLDDGRRAITGIEQDQPKGEGIAVQQLGQGTAIASVFS